MQQKKKPKHFKDFRELISPKTDRRFSPMTISFRLKKLEKIHVLERVVSKTASGRVTAATKSLRSELSS